MEQRISLVELLCTVTSLFISLTLSLSLSLGLCYMVIQTSPIVPDLKVALFQSFGSPSSSGECNDIMEIDGARQHPKRIHSRDLEVSVFVSRDIYQATCRPQKQTSFKGKLLQGSSCLPRSSCGNEVFNRSKRCPTESNRIIE